LIQKSRVSATMVSRLSVAYKIGLDVRWVAARKTHSVLLKLSGLVGGASTSTLRSMLRVSASFMSPTYLPAQRNVLLPLAGFQPVRSMFLAGQGEPEFLREIIADDADEPHGGEQRGGEEKWAAERGTFRASRTGS
jgi:hypothetical protein